MTLESFHEVRFPTDLARGATGGPERRTEVISLASGREQRNTRWAHSRRRYNAGYGIKTLEDLQTVVAFFEERRGRLYGFRFRDPFDWKSSTSKNSVSELDQLIGVGDGETVSFHLSKQYGAATTGYRRNILKPVDGTIRLAVNQMIVPQAHYTANSSTGEIVFLPQHVPDAGHQVHAGFEFDVPVRFDTDEISVNLSHFEAGDIPSIPLVELLI